MIPLPVTSSLNIRAKSQLSVMMLMVALALHADVLPRACWRGLEFLLELHAVHSPSFFDLLVKAVLATSY